MEWITRDLAKAFLRVDGDDEDDLIDLLIDAVKSQIESVTGLCLDSRTVNLIVDRWADLSRLTVAPVTSVVEIDFIDPTGAVNILAPSHYRLASRGLAASIYPASGVTLPATIGEAGISVTLQCGYAPDAIPGAVRQALLLALGDAYTFREGTVADRSVTPTELPNGIAALLTNFRVM